MFVFPPFPTKFSHPFPCPNSRNTRFKGKGKDFKPGISEETHNQYGAVDHTVTQGDAAAADASQLQLGLLLH